MSEEPEEPTTGTGRLGTGLLHPGDAGAALMLLTRIPCPAWLASDRGAQAAWAWPVVGALVAILSWAVGAQLRAFGLPDGIAAAATIGTAIVLTGALHEDGLADCADGFWGGPTSERRLEILRDSRIGSYGVVALGLVIGMKWLSVAALFGEGAALAVFVSAAMLSRAGMAGVMSAMRFARDDGLAVHSGRPAAVTAVLAIVVAVTGSFVMLGMMAAVVAACTALVAATGTAAVARAKIGGQTGDVLGAVQQVTELTVLVTCLALLS